jgi:prophage regulatory protein
MKMYRFHDLRAAGIPWSRKYLFELEKRRAFPRRVHVGSNTIAWVADEVDQFIIERCENREQPQPQPQQTCGRGRKQGSRVVNGRVIGPEASDANV